MLFDRSDNDLNFGWESGIVSIVDGFPVKIFEREPGLIAFGGEVADLTFALGILATAVVDNQQTLNAPEVLCGLTL